MKFHLIFREIWGYLPETYLIISGSANTLWKNEKINLEFRTCRIVILKQCWMFIKFNLKFEKMHFKSSFRTYIRNFSSIRCVYALIPPCSTVRIPFFMRERRLMQTEMLKLIAFAIQSNVGITKNCSSVNNLYTAETAIVLIGLVLAVKMRMQISVHVRVFRVSSQERLIKCTPHSRTQL